jgi:DNA-binding beta-propeller fold protein YncE
MNELTTVERTLRPRRTTSSLLAALAAAVFVAVGCQFLVPPQKAVAQVNQEQPPDFLLQWGSQGSGEGQFDGPAGVAVDSSGNVYVTDFNNHRIQKFTADGEFLAQWGSQGSGEGQLFFPRGVAVDTSGNVYVADPGNSRIQKFGIATADTTPPILKLPEEGITVNAIGADGALVTFEVSATDDTDPNPVVNCSPASRSTFPIGTTTVTCTATDSSGKTASGTFPLTVIGATDQISDLKELVTNLPRLPAGTNTSLQTKLNDALSAANGGDTASACTALKDFISQVSAQQGKKRISAQDAEKLIGEAQRIQAVLGC